MTELRLNVISVNESILNKKLMAKQNVNMLYTGTYLS